MLYLKKDEILKILNDEERRKWFINEGIQAPPHELKALSVLLEEVGVKDIVTWTAEASDLYDCQHLSQEETDEKDVKDRLELLLRK